MIVVDTNVIAYFLLPGPFAQIAEDLYKHDSDWAMPLLWRSEFRNVLAGFLRRKTLEFDEVCALQRRAERLMLGSGYEVESDAVLSLVNTSNCSSYDCEFVALALRLDTQLVTSDRQLLRAFPGLTIPLI